MTAPIRPGAGPVTLWAGEEGARTDVAVLYIHGFSASPVELSPYPEQVAATFGANYHAPLLDGHGRDGAALAAATRATWVREVEAALDRARAMGERVVVMSCSTGGTLVAEALSRSGPAARVVASVFVAPNAGLKNPAGRMLLGLPLARHWVPYVAGRERSFDMPPSHQAVWTARYPTTALFPMHEALVALRRADLSRATASALFLYSDKDTVVSAADTDRLIPRWGGPTRVEKLDPLPGDDPGAHLLAGIAAPNGTARLTDLTVAWLRGVLA